MLSMIILIFGALMTTMMTNHPLEQMQFSERVGTPVGETLLYYQNMAVTSCIQPSTNKITCSPGVIPLRTRDGASQSMGYGSSFISSTDGSSYIMTTLGSPNIGSLNLNRSKNAWLLDYIDRATEHSVTVGYYNAATGRVELMNMISTADRPNYVMPQFLKPPFDGQPVIYLRL